MNPIDIFILAAIIIFVVAFFIRNLFTYLQVKKSIRGASFKLSLSILLSMINYLLAIMLVIWPKLENYLLIINLPSETLFVVTGVILVTLALILGLSSLYIMKSSWRVGIRHEQKTQLIVSGVYSYTRNPYFISYGWLFTGILLVHASLVLLLSTAALMITFHYMILEEENYLLSAHGNSYRKYMKTTPRYLMK